MNDFRQRELPLSLAPKYQEGGMYETEVLKNLKTKYNTEQLIPTEYSVGEDDGVPVVYPIVYVDQDSGELIELDSADAFQYSIFNRSIKAFETETEANDFVKQFGKEPQMKKRNKSPKKYQLGGVDLSALGDIDFSNYESVLAGAQEIMPNAAWTAAIGGDDPKILTDSILAGVAQSGVQPPNATSVHKKAIELAAQDGKGAWAASLYKDQATQALMNQSTRLSYGASQMGYNQFGNLFSLLDTLQFQSGGSIMGYRDDSPYKDMPHMVIDGNIIDMSETGRELKLIPDVGKPKIAKPYSGIHKFPGASKILEIPVMKKGGKKKKAYNYQEGGEGAIGAQLEVGEVFATPDVNIFDTSATEKHKNMDDDLVTDVLGPEDYVFSDMDKMKASKKELEDLHFGMGGVHYKEGEVADQPVESNAGDILKENEKEIKLSDYVKRVRDDYPLTDRDDMFARKSNAGNKQSRVPYIAAAAHLNEKKKKGVSGYATRFENRFNQIPAANANPEGSDTSRAAMPMNGVNAAGVPEGQLGGIVNSVMNLLGGIGKWFGAGQDYKDTLAALDVDRRMINRQANTASRYSTLSTTAGLAGTVAQNPYVQAPQYDSTQLDASIRKVPRNYFDLAIARLNANTQPTVRNFFRNSGNISQGVNYATQLHANNAGAMANLGMQEIQQNIGLENQYRSQKQVFNDRQTLADSTARDATRANSNQLLAGAAGQVSGGIQGLGQIQNDRISALRDNNMARTQAKLNRRAQRHEAFTGVASSIGYGTDAVQQYIQSRKDTPEPPVADTTADFDSTQVPYTQGPYHGSYLTAPVPNYGSFQGGSYRGMEAIGKMFYYDPVTGQWKPE